MDDRTERSETTPFELIDAHNAVSYLRRTGRIPADESAEVLELAGGVSNMVLLVRVANRQSPQESSREFVLKQGRPQLRVADPWFCGVDRIHREVEVLGICETLFSSWKERSLARSKIGTPRILFQDRENYLFAMEAIPAHEVWKAQLMRGVCDPEVAQACGNLLGILHAASWRSTQVEAKIGDQQFFEALRIDPYYRQIARVHPVLNGPIRLLIEALSQNRLALVHGDFSPKNLLIHAAGVTLVDCEVGHYGDPAFDLGFFLTHLVLKAVHFRSDRYVQLIDAFWATYLRVLSTRVPELDRRQLEVRTVVNLLACALARVDGKSKVEYLSAAERGAVREFCLTHLPSPPESMMELRHRLLPHMVAVSVGSEDGHA